VRELDPLVVRVIGCPRVDSDRVVTVGAQHRHEPAERAAPDLDHSRRRSGQTGAYDWPRGGKPSLAWRHLAILRATLTTSRRR
jgi:hypothetical protein